MPVNDQADLSSFDHRQRNSKQRPKGTRIKSLNDARLLCRLGSIVARTAQSHMIIHTPAVTIPDSSVTITEMRT
jgi:hypothetical protein